MIPSIIRRVISRKQDLPEDAKVFYNINFPPCQVSEAKVRLLPGRVWLFDDRYERVEVESHHSGEGFMIYGEKGHRSFRCLRFTGIDEQSYYNYTA